MIIGPHGAMNPKSEYAYVREAGVTVFHVSDVDRRGARAIAEQAVKIASDGTDGVYCRSTSTASTARSRRHVRAHHGRAHLARGADDGVADRPVRSRGDGRIEVAPAYDNGESAMAACQVLVDTLAAYADAHR